MSAFKILSPSRFSITFTGTLPIGLALQRARPADPHPAARLGQGVGQRARWAITTITPAGAQAVYNFLAAQNKDLSTYATNPLWQVVDGPWKLTSYAASTGDATYVRNTAVLGPATGSIHALRVLSFTSDAAEFDSLLSAGGITYGYMPFNDAAQVGTGHLGRLQGRGLADLGHHLHQHELRVAAGRGDLQAAVRPPGHAAPDQPGRATSARSCTGTATRPTGRCRWCPAASSCPAPRRQNPYPYDPSAATALLRAHGWKIVPGGTDTVHRGPGPAADDCGAGIASGEKLAFGLRVLDRRAGGQRGGRGAAVGVQPGRDPAGADAAPRSAPSSADDVPCTKSSCWQLNYYGQGWYFDPGYNDPDGSVLFDSTGVDNGGLYDSPAANALISKLPSGGYPALYAYQDYLAKQLPMLWMPQLDEQISAVNDKLKGVYPQDPLGNIYPENWYFVK